MLKNYLLTALRNLSRNRLYAGVSIAGLAIGLAAALLITVFVRDEYSYDRWIPDHERVYRLESVFTSPGEPTVRVAQTTPLMKRVLEVEFPEIEATSRLTGGNGLPAVRRGEISANEQRLYWVDEDFLRIVPVPAVAGDPASALTPPDGLVLTRSMARKYFGRDDPLGQLIEVNGETHRVTAVIEDLPTQSHLAGDIFVSAAGPRSGMRRVEEGAGPFTNNITMYVKLKPGVSPESIARRMPQVLERHIPVRGSRIGNIKREIRLVPVAEVHLGAPALGELKPTADAKILAAIAAVGALIVLVAGVNFVTLMTARATRRAVEVGVRKSAGATRSDLIVQFIGEAFLYVALSAVLAVALAELLLPAANLLTQRRMSLDYIGDPTLLGGLLLVTVVLSVLAGAYPALVLSGFQPAAVLKGGPVQAAGGGRLRQVLVVFQFSVLIALIVLAATIYRQTTFALNDAMRVDKDGVAVIYAQPCTRTLRDEMRRLPGVEQAACGSVFVYEWGNFNDTIRLGDREVVADVQPVDFGFFELYGLKPLAGRFFDERRAADSALAAAPVVINETAARRLGFTDPAQAVGQSLSNRFDPSRVNFEVMPPPRSSEIIGVVSDFSFGSIRERIPPTLYFAGATEPLHSTFLTLKLKKGEAPAAMKAMDQAWKRLGEGRPMSRFFVSEGMMRHYVDALIQGAVIAVCSIIALSIACLGLFALSAYTTERRTKEIGIRKAMGASAGDVLKLLIWQFSKPVLIANLIAWPIAFFVARDWLEGFAYRVDLAPWTFLAAGAAALFIAWSTVFVHALKVSRAKPVGALRYE